MAKTNTTKMAHRAHRNNQVRIIGGDWRGRKIHFPDALGLRPTPDAVRERLFNWLGQDLTGLTVLDAFAGSGALGLEAASRHAKRVVMVERQQRVAQTLNELAQQWHAQQVQIQCADVMGYLKHNDECFDVVFADPPFDWQDWASFFTLLRERLQAQAWVYVEAKQLPELPEYFEIYREGKAGMSRQVLLQFIV